MQQGPRDGRRGSLKEKLRNVPANLDFILKRLADQAGQARDYVRWVTASQGNELRLITADEICYFQADNKYTLVVTSHQKSLIRRRPIKELVNELDPAVFRQIHRGTLVNVNAIAGVIRDIGGHLRARLKERKEALPASDPYGHRFKQM